MERYKIQDKKNTTTNMEINIGLQVTKQTPINKGDFEQRHQRRIEPRPRATCIKIWWSSVGRFSSYASGQTLSVCHTYR